MPEPEPDFEAILSTLSGADVDFIVVGGVCAVLHGAPVSTFDLDLVYSRNALNLQRLEKVLAELEAAYREKPEISPDASRLDGPGHHLLMTKFGPLDLLGSIVGGEGYEELIESTERVDIGAPTPVSILDLPTLIRHKEKLGRDRDMAVLPILRRTLEERQRRDGIRDGS
jgi:hypothetical protein